MRKLLRLLLKQHQLGQLPGAVKHVFNSTLGYVGYINFSLIVAVAYNTTLRDPLQQYFPWLTFPMFIGVMVVVVGLAMLIEYKLMMPSSISFGLSQSWRHRNPVRTELEKINKRLEKIEKKLEGECDTQSN